MGKRRGEQKTAIASFIRDEVRSLSTSSSNFSNFLSLFKTENTHPHFQQRARPGPGGEIRGRNILRDCGKSSTVLFFSLFERVEVAARLSPPLAPPLLDTLPSFRSLPNSLLNTKNTFTSWPCASSSRRWSGGRRRIGAPTSWCRFWVCGSSPLRSRRGEKRVFVFLI